MTEMDEAQRALEEASERAAELGRQQRSTELTRVEGKLDAEKTRREMTQVQRRLEREERAVERAAARVRREMDRQVDRMRRDLEGRMDKVNEALEPVRKRLELMEEGIETLGLYLSAAKNVVTIRDGERAHQEEPIIIRQMVLAMDEETGIFAKDGGLVAEDVDAFDRWLLADPAHVEQVIPEKKSVVALVARWRERQEGNPWSRDPKDRVTHFLIRNGEALFRTTVSDFMAGAVLLPRADEFISYFFRRTHFWEEKEHGDQRPLKPGTREYAEAMERSSKHSRHFLRIGLILQGLVDNADVLEPLHPAGINMLTDPSLRSEKVRIITDAEGGLESGEETFLDWRARVNARLRPGMRIIGSFSGYDSPWRQANDWHNNKYPPYGHSRVWPTGWDHPEPPSGVPLLIEDRRQDGGLVCRFERGEIYDKDLWTPLPDRPGWGHRGGKRPAKLRASVTVYPSDDFILAYDLIESSDQLRRFLASRRNRKEYRQMWPLIRSAMFAKQAEEKAERPFQRMLAGVLARENGVTVAEAEADLGELIQWFKLKNRWTRPLTLETMVGMEAMEVQSDREAEENERTRGGRLTSRAMAARRERVGWDAEEEYDEARYQAALEEQARKELKGQAHSALAVRMIVAEHARRVKDRQRPVNRVAVEALRKAHPDALLIGRRRGGEYVVLQAAHPTENVWVHELEYSVRGPKLRKTQHWRLVSADRASRWTIAYEHPRWKEWDLHASERDHLRGPESEQLVTRVRVEAVGDGERLLMVSYNPGGGEQRAYFTAWVIARNEPGAEEPSYKARDFFWKRNPTGEVELVRPKSVGYWHRDETEWTGWQSAELPWEGRFSKSHVGRIVWGPDKDAVAAWAKLRKKFLQRQEREREIRDRAQSLQASIRDQWHALKENELHAKFVAEVPDWQWEEWDDYRREHELGYPDDTGLWSLLHWLVKHKIDPTGMTVREALGVARERGLPKTWKDYGDRCPYPESWPELDQLVFGAEPVAVPEEPGEDEPEPEEDDSLLNIGEGVDVVGPEEPEEEQDDFDRLRDTLRDVTP